MLIRHSIHPPYNQSFHPLAFLRHVTIMDFRLGNVVFDVINNVNLRLIRRPLSAFTTVRILDSIRFIDHQGVQPVGFLGFVVGEVAAAFEVDFALDVVGETVLICRMKRVPPACFPGLMVDVIGTAIGIDFTLDVGWER